MECLQNTIINYESRDWHRVTGGGDRWSVFRSGTLLAILCVIGNILSPGFYLDWGALRPNLNLNISPIGLYSDSHKKTQSDDIQIRKVVSRAVHKFELSFFYFIKMLFLFMYFILTAIVCFSFQSQNAKAVGNFKTLRPYYFKELKVCVCVHTCMQICMLGPGRNNLAFPLSQSYLLSFFPSLSLSLFLSHTTSSLPSYLLSFTHTHTLTVVNFFLSVKFVTALYVCFSLAKLLSQLWTRVEENNNI